MATRALAPELYEPWVTSIIFQEFAEMDPIYTQILNTRTTDMAFEDSFTVAGLTRFMLKPEGTPVAFDDIVQGDRKREIVLTYALGFRATEEALEDEQQGILTIAKMASELGLSSKDSIERLAHGPINDGVTGASFKGNPEGDGTRRALWSTGHVPLKNTNATQSNRVSPGVALSESGLQSALLLFRLTQSEEERFVNNTPKTLLIHPENEVLAHKLLETTQAVGSANNDINYFSRLGFKIVMSPYITDTDSWSLWGTKHYVDWVSRKSLTITNATDALTGDRMTLGRFRAFAAFTSWRGSVGVTP